MRLVSSAFASSCWLALERAVSLYFQEQPCLKLHIYSSKWLAAQELFAAFTVLYLGLHWYNQMKYMLFKQWNCCLTIRAAMHSSSDVSSLLTLDAQEICCSTVAMTFMNSWELLPLAGSDHSIWKPNSMEYERHSWYSVSTQYEDVYLLLNEWKGPDFVKSSFLK